MKFPPIGYKDIFNSGKEREITQSDLKTLDLFKRVQSDKSLFKVYTFVKNWGSNRKQRGEWFAEIDANSSADSLQDIPKYPSPLN